MIILNLWISLAWSQSLAPKNFWESTKQRLNQIWTQGKGDLFVPAYAWHNRFFYDKNRVHIYNEYPWGAGFGKGIWDEHGNWQGLYLVVFQDSHKEVQPMGGYAYLLTHHPSENTGLGLGFTLMMTARADIQHYLPFPGILPLASMNYKNLMLLAAYVPGRQNIGNIVFLSLKLTLDH